MSGVVLIGDPHFSSRKAFGSFSKNSPYPGTNSRFTETALAFARIVDYASTNHVEAIFVLGDVFHNRGNIEIPVYNGVYSLFKDCVSKGIQLVIYPGNHDMVDLRAMHAESDHLHSLFSYESLAHLYDSASLHETTSFIAGVIPFSPNADAVVAQSAVLLSKAKQRAPNKIKILLLHHSISGALTGPHEWKMPSELKAENLADWDLIFSGHYHRHQQIGKMWYVGAPLQHDLGEREYKPGFVHIKPDGSWHHVENNLSPRFNILDTNNQEDVIGLDSHNYNIVKWRGSESDVTKLNSLDNVLIEILPSTKKSVARTTISISDSVEDMLQKYLQTKTGSLSDLDLGLSLFRGE